MRIWGTLLILLLIVGCTGDSVREFGTFEQADGTETPAEVHDIDGVKRVRIQPEDAATETPPPTYAAKRIEYPDASKGGTFEVGDKVEYLGVKGGIYGGHIENGEITSSTFIIKDESDRMLLNYNQHDDPDYGHLELIMYPQEEGEDNSVIMKQDGKDTGVCLIYDPSFNFNNYVTATFSPEQVPESLKGRLYC